MKRFTKKLVAALLSGAMVLGMSITSFAAAPAISVGEGDTEANVTKTWNVADSGLFNDTENFDFTLTYKGATPVGSNATATPQYNGSEMGSKDVDITTDWAENATDTSSTGTLSYVKLFEGITFSAPGEYSFTLDEIDGSNPNISYDPSTYTIKVQVVWDTVGETLKIGGIVTSKVGEAGGTKTGSDGKEGASFTNDAADNESLTISKTVAGNAANKDDVFSFTITVNGIDGTYSTNVEGKTVTNGVATEFTLKHGDNFEIYNLPVGATYTVEETDTQNYSSTEVSVNKANATDGTKVTNQAIVDGTNTVDYTNTNTVGTPTGIFLNFVPFILIFGAAVLGCFVFFRRRRTW